MNDVVGRTVQRVDAIEKVTGRAKFTADLKLPGMLVGKIVRSTLPHARIVHIERERARNMPGVHAVLTSRDFSDLKLYYGSALRDRPLLADGKVRYIGEPVAVVVAEDEWQAREAAAAVHVQYEDLEPVFTVEEALAPGAPLLHEGWRVEGDFHGLKGLDVQRSDNICYECVESQGDVEAAFAMSDLIVENTFTFPAVFHYALEPHAVLADVREDSIHVWATQQHPYILRADLSNMFGIPYHRIRVTVPYIGGGFGGKGYTQFEPLAVAASRFVCRPVQIVLDIDEVFSTICRHAVRIRIKTGVRCNGELLARQGWIELNTGAYADNGPRVAARAAQRLLGVYRSEAYHVVARAVYTNTVPAGSFRSIGGPQAVWACESQMDIIAEKLGMDAFELRLRNVPERGEIFRQGNKGMDADVKSHLRLAAEKIGYFESTYARGLACSATGGGAGPMATAMVRMHADGSIMVHSSGVEIGQGVRTVHCQIAAETLGVEIDRVRIFEPDTDATPFDRSTGSSRSTVVVGTAIQMAAEDLLKQLQDIASIITGSRPGEITVGGGVVITPRGRWSYEEVIQKFYGMAGGELIGRGYSGPYTAPQIATRPVFWEIGVGAAEVDVDRETGEINLRKYVAVTDVGKAINPLLCRGQEWGAVMQGVGHTLFEEMVYRQGQLLNDNMIDYRVPMFPDIPVERESELVENKDGPGPFGARGIGEGGTVPAAPAIANALYRAVGVRINDLPLTPERVWRSLRIKNEKDAAKMQ